MYRFYEKYFTPDLSQPCWTGSFRVTNFAPFTLCCFLIEAESVQQSVGTQHKQRPSSPTHSLPPLPFPPLLIEPPLSTTTRTVTNNNKYNKRRENNRISNAITVPDKNQGRRGLNTVENGWVWWNLLSVDLKWMTQDIISLNIPLIIIIIIIITIVTWFIHNPESVLEKETHKILWDFEIQKKTA